MQHFLLIPVVTFALTCNHAISQAQSVKNATRQSPAQVCRSKPMTSTDAARERAALERFDSGDIATARPSLSALAQEFPCRYELQAAVGMAAAQLDDTAAAGPFLQRAHSLRPTDEAISFNLALVELKNGNAAEASRLLQRLAQHSPLRADVQIAFASALMQDKQPALAAEAYRKAASNLTASKQPVPLDLRMDWASALMKSKKMTEARDVLRRAEGLQESSSALELLAESEEASGEYEDAVHHFERAAHIDPSEATILAYGNELLQHRTFGPAIEILKYGVTSFPASERMHLALGAAYFNNGMYDLAAPEFYLLLLRSPQNSLAADMLGRSCSYTTAAALKECAALESFAQQHPDNAITATYAATAILQRPAESRDMGMAENLLRSAVRTDPGLAEAWYQIGVIEQSRNQWEAAAAPLKRAISLQPEFADAHYRLSRSYSHMGRREDAVAEVNLEMKYRQEAKDANSLRMQNIVRFLTAEKQPE